MPSCLQLLLMYKQAREIFILGMCTYIFRHVTWFSVFVWPNMCFFCHHTYIYIYMCYSHHIRQQCAAKQMIFILAVRALAGNFSIWTLFPCIPPFGPFHVIESGGHHNTGQKSCRTGWWCAIVAVAGLLEERKLLNPYSAKDSIHAVRKYEKEKKKISWTESAIKNIMKWWCAVRSCFFFSFSFVLRHNLKG